MPHLRAYIWPHQIHRYWGVRMFRKSFALVCLLLVGGMLLSGCGAINSPSVAVTASGITVDATDAVTLTAAVTDDTNSAGVTWTVTGGGTLSNTTTSAATYTAPAASSTALTVTVTATSIANTAKSGTATSHKKEQRSNRSLLHCANKQTNNTHTHTHTHTDTHTHTHLCLRISRTQFLLSCSSIARR